MKLTWYGHSCFFVDTELGSAVFDPYSPGSVPGLALPPLAADTVICSHGHRDHCCAQGVKQTKRTVAFRVKQIPTFHDNCGGRERGENLVTVIEAEGLSVAHLGDLGHMLSPAQAEALGRVDILMIPVGGYFTIDAATARDIVELLRPHIVIPMHYRGEGFGYDAISSPDGFLSMFDNVVYLDSNVLTPDMSGAPYTAVLRCPVAGAEA